MNRPHVTLFLASAVLSTAIVTSPQTIAYADDVSTASTISQPEPALDSWMPDKNLQTNLQSLLGNAVPLTQANLAKLTSVNLTYSDITNLKGLEFAKNLQQLDLTGNAISDVSPLGQLPQLTNLSLRLNKAEQLPDLAVLQTAPIQQLNLVGDAYGSAPDQLAGLRNLTQLQSLKLVNSKLTTLPPIAPAAPLSELDLSGNKLADVSGLTNFTSLTSLSLGSNQIADWRPVAGLKQLINLTAGNNPQTNIAVLQSLTQLKKLNLSQLGMTNQDLRLVSNMTNLQNLAIDFNGNISDLSPLSRLSQLTDLDFSKDAVSDLTPLQPLVQLVNLTLSNNLVTDLKPLQGLMQLSNLTILRNQVRDLSPLKNLSKLTYLNAKYQFVTMPNLSLLSGSHQFSLPLSAKDIDGTVIPLTYQSGTKATVIGDQVTYSDVTAAGQTNFAWDNATSKNKLSTRFSGSLVQPLAVVQDMPKPAAPNADTVEETVKLSVMKGDNQNLTSVASNYILQKATLTKHSDGSGVLTFTANVPANYGKDSITFKDATQVAADLVGTAYILTYDLPLSANQLAETAILEDMHVAINLPGFDYNHAYQVYFNIAHNTDFMDNQPTPPIALPTITTESPVVIASAVRPMISANSGVRTTALPISTQSRAAVLEAQSEQPNLGQPATTLAQKALNAPTDPRQSKTSHQPQPEVASSAKATHNKPASTPENQKKSTARQPVKNTHHVVKFAVFASSLLGVIGLYGLRFLRK